MYRRLRMQGYPRSTNPVRSHCGEVISQSILINPAQTKLTKPDSFYLQTLSCHFHQLEKPTAMIKSKVV